MLDHHIVLSRFEIVDCELTLHVSSGGMVGLTIPCVECDVCLSYRLPSGILYDFASDATAGIGLRWGSLKCKAGCDDARKNDSKAFHRSTSSHSPRGRHPC